MTHAFRVIEDTLFTTPAAYASRSKGFRRADLIGRDQGSVHMKFSIAELASGGHTDPIVNAFEKGIFVLEGEVELNRDGKAFRLGQHDYAMVPVGTAHAFRNRGKSRTRWVEKCAPRPKEPDEWQDSFFVPKLAWPADDAIGSAKTPLARFVGHFDPSQLPAPIRRDQYMWGWSRKTLIDHMFGGHHFELFIIEFADGGQTNDHDHNFEEAYLVLEGEVTFTAEGKEYVLKPGTIAWSGVGAPHAFYLNRGGPCRWLEVMSPQPPTQDVGRRMSHWDDYRKAMEG